MEWLNDPRRTMGRSDRGRHARMAPYQHEQVRDAPIADEISVAFANLFLFIAS